MYLISYNSKNEDFAELVKMKLEKEDIQVWKDTSQIDAQEKGAQGSTNIATELIDLITSHFNQQMNKEMVRT